MDQPVTGFIRLRLSGADAHYAGGLVDGARILQLMSDAVTEALIRHDGDEGLMRAMTTEHLAPVHSGDYLEIRATLVAVGESSRRFECTAHRIIELIEPDVSAANVLAEPILVAKADCAAVVPKGKQRGAR